MGWIIVGVLVATLMLAFYGGGAIKTNMNVNVDKNAMWNLISMIAVALIIGFIVPKAFPVFWGRYYNSDLFLPTLIGMGVTFFLWKVRYLELPMWIFFILLVFVIYKFGNFGSYRSKQKTEEVVNFQIHNLENGDIYYLRTPFKGQINVAARITPECGKKIRVQMTNPQHELILVGCSRGNIQSPAQKHGNRFIITAVQ